MQFSAEAIGAGDGAASRPVDVALSVRGPIEPGQRPSAQLVLPNNTAGAVACKVAYSLQADGAMFSETPPDPVFGRDRALGMRSWTELTDLSVIPDDPAHALAGRRLRATCALIAGTSRVDVAVLVCMPLSLPRRNHRILVIRRPYLGPHLRSDGGGLPRHVGGSASASSFSRPFDVHSRYGLHTHGAAKRPFPPRASAASSPPRPSRLLPGGMTISRAGLAPAGLQHPYSRRTT